MAKEKIKNKNVSALHFVGYTVPYIFSKNKIK